MGNKVREREKGRRGEESGGGMRQTRDSGLNTQYELGIAYNEGSIAPCNSSKSILIHVVQYT